MISLDRLQHLFHNVLSTRYIVIALLALFASIPSFAEEYPKVRIESITRVFYNGEHNSFTDICSFDGKYYLAFRSCPDGHMVHPTSSIIVLSSSDTKNWRQVYRFSVPKRDTRDPHFLTFNNKLFVYTGTWYCGDTSPESYDLNEQLGYAVWTEDGTVWSDPVMLEGTYGHYIWRASSYGGKAYLNGRRKREFIAQSHRETREMIESAMLESDDGLIWKKAALFQERDGDETAFRFEPDGSVIAVARRGRGQAQICRSNPPYTEWRRLDLDRYIGGPLLAVWNGRYIVGGRQATGGGSITSLYWLSGENGLVDMVSFPSGGDNSYPGFVELGPEKALVSYYSSHEKNDEGETITAIYLAVLVME